MKAQGAPRDAARDADRLPGPVRVAQPAHDRRRHRRRAARRPRDRRPQLAAPEARERLLEVVGFNPDFINRYPHEFSGGQRQRIGVARALALNPRLIICDEPVSALDVSIQAQILNLLKDLQQEFNLAYLFVAHDLAVVRTMSDRIAVMNKGKIVETGVAESVYSDPKTSTRRRCSPQFPCRIRGRCRPGARSDASSRVPSQSPSRRSSAARSLSASSPSRSPSG